MGNFARNPRISKLISLYKAKDLAEHPLKKPKQDPNYDIWYHLLIDIQDGKNLDSHSKIKQFFAETIKSIKMKPLSDILVVSVDNEEGRGTSAVQLIVTSTITFHSDDRYECAFLDFFSCKTFDPKVVIKLIKKYFEPEKIRTKFIYREEEDH